MYIIFSFNFQFQIIRLYEIISWAIISETWFTLGCICPVIRIMCMVGKMCLTGINESFIWYFPCFSFYILFSSCIFSTIADGIAGSIPLRIPAAFLNHHHFSTIADGIAGSVPLWIPAAFLNIFHYTFCFTNPKTSPEREGLRIF